MRDEIQKKIVELRASRGNSVPIEEIGEIVDGILGSVQGEISGADLRLYHEVQALAEYIEVAKSEIAQINPSDIKNEHLQIANDELDAIIAHTEEATGAILDAAEKVENVAGTVDEAQSKILNDAVTAIYEASSFQDVTGQRITRIIYALKDIEEKVSALIGAFGGGIDSKSSAEAAPSEKNGVEIAEKKKKDEDLLNGPQLPGNAQSQEDIDALLASFD